MKTADLIFACVLTSILLWWTPVEAEPYPAEIVDAFTQECVSTNATQQVCACLVDRMQAEIPLEALMAGRFTEEAISNWTQECVAAINLVAPLDGAMANLSEPKVKLSCEGAGLANCKRIALCFADCKDQSCMQDCLDSGTREHCEFFLELLSCSQRCAGDMGCMERSCSSEVRESCRQ